MGQEQPCCWLQVCTDPLFVQVAVHVYSFTRLTCSHAFLVSCNWSSLHPCWFFLIDFPHDVYKTTSVVAFIVRRFVAVIDVFMVYINALKGMSLQHTPGRTEALTVVSLIPSPSSSPLFSEVSEQRCHRCVVPLPRLPDDWLLALLPFQIVTPTNLWPKSSEGPHVAPHLGLCVLCYRVWTTGPFVTDGPCINQWQQGGNSVSHWLMQLCTRIFSQPYISFFPPLRCLPFCLSFVTSLIVAGYSRW